MAEPKQESIDKMWKYVKGFAERSGTTVHPNPAVTEAVVKGLTMHVDELGPAPEKGRALRHKVVQSPPILPESKSKKRVAGDSKQSRL